MKVNVYIIDRLPWLNKLKRMSEWMNECVGLQSDSIISQANPKCLCHYSKGASNHGVGGGQHPSNFSLGPIFNYFKTEEKRGAA
jgi:hypothetical protein